MNLRPLLIGWLCLGVACDDGASAPDAGQTPVVDGGLVPDRDLAPEPEPAPEPTPAPAPEPLPEPMPEPPRPLFDDGCQITADCAHPGARCLDNRCVVRCDYAGDDAEACPEPLRCGRDGRCAPPNCDQLDADCPAGSYCDLDECRQACSVERPCPDGEACNRRGLCEVAGEAPAEPTGRLVPSVDYLDLPPDADTVVFDLEAFHTDPAAQRPIGYRIETDAGWVRVPRPRGAVIDSTRVELPLEREALAAGQHQARVSVLTDGGKQFGIIVNLAQGIDAVYGGTVTIRCPACCPRRRCVDAPVLGRLPIRLTTRAGPEGLAVRIDGRYSPLFPEVDRASATLLAAPDGDAFTGVLTEHLTQEVLGGEARALLPGVDRETRLTLRVDGTGLSGEFSQQWFVVPAQLGEQVAIYGELTLDRLDDLPVRDFIVAEPVPLQAPERAFIDPPSAACVGAATTILGESEGYCDPALNADRPGRLVSCADAVVEYGSRLDRLGVAVYCSADVPDGEPTPVVAAAEACRDDLLVEGSLATTTEGPDRACCLRMANLECAAQLYGAADRLGNIFASGGVAISVAQVLSAAALVVNEDLAGSFSAPILEGANLRGRIEAPLLAGQAVSSMALRHAFRPDLLDRVLQADPRVVRDDGSPLSRSLAILIARDVQLAVERLDLRLRAGEVEPPELALAASHEVMRFLTAIGLFTAVARQHEPDPDLVADLGLLSTALTDFGGLLVAARTFEGDANALRSYLLNSLTGAAGFLATAQGGDVTVAWNYERELERAEEQIDDAVANENQAAGSLRAYEQALNSLQTQARVVGDQISCRLAAICGLTSGVCGGSPSNPVPAVDECGLREAEGGELVVRTQSELGAATIALAEAAHELELASTQVEQTEARIAAEWRRLEQIDGINAAEIRIRGEIGVTSARAQLRAASKDAWASRMNVMAGLAQKIPDIVGSFTPGPKGGIPVVSGLLSLFSQGAAFGLQLGAVEMQHAAQVTRIQGQRVTAAQELRLYRLNHERARIDRLATIEQLNAAQTLQELQAAQQLERWVNAGLRVNELLIERDRLLNEFDSLVERQFEVNYANEPTFRILRDNQIRLALANRGEARRRLLGFLRSFAFDVNLPLPAGLASQVHQALNAGELQRLLGCVGAWRGDYFDDVLGGLDVPNENGRVTVGLRALLGIDGPIPDTVSQACVPPRVQLVERFTVETAGGAPALRIRFATPLWSPDDALLLTAEDPPCVPVDQPLPVGPPQPEPRLTGGRTCNARVRRVRARVDGAGIASETVRIVLRQSATTYQRSCVPDPAGGPSAIHQHAFPTAVPVELTAIVNADFAEDGWNTQLAGRALHADWWEIDLPFDGANAALDTDGDGALTRGDLVGLEDIYLEFEFASFTVNGEGRSPDFSNCDFRL